MDPLWVLRGLKDQKVDLVDPLWVLGGLKDQKVETLSYVRGPFGTVLT